MTAAVGSPPVHSAGFSTPLCKVLDSTSQGFQRDFAHEIRTPTPGDLDAIAALDADAFGPRAWSRDAWAAELAAPDRHIRLCATGEDVAAVATFKLLGDDVDLLRVVVAPDARRHGIASRLIADGARWARSHGATRMLLEVSASNHPAHTLYTARGFTEIARRRGYYAPGDDAIVMEVSL